MLKTAEEEFVTVNPLAPVEDGLPRNELLHGRCLACPGEPLAPGLPYRQRFHDAGPGVSLLMQNRHPRSNLELFLPIPHRGWPKTRRRPL